MSTLYKSHTRSSTSIPTFNSNSYYKRAPNTSSTSGSMVSMGLLSNRSKSCKSKLTSFLGSRPIDECVFCKNKKKTTYVSNMVNKSLYLKYSSS